MPKQSEVQQWIDDARNGYVTFNAVHTDVHHTCRRQWGQQAGAIGREAAGHKLARKRGLELFVDDGRGKIQRSSA